MDSVKYRSGGFHIRVTTLLQFVVLALGLPHGKVVGGNADWTDVHPAPRGAPDYAAASRSLSVHDILGRRPEPRRQLQGLAPGPSPSSVSESSMSSNNTTAIAAVVCVLIIVVGGVLACYYYQRKRNGITPLRKRASNSNIQEVITSITQANGAVTVFKLKELEKATENFGEHLVLGLGGFGTVYKGTLRNGMVHVAIKVLNATSKSGKKQQMNEISILLQTSHPNLVQLFGCCIETEVPILVYEYIPNGNLFEHLHRLRFGVNLNWAKRLQIASETADALAYLHFAAQPPIYHRDVKSANILLDNTFSVKVADFGISRLTNPEKSHVPTAVQGTPGYLDSEYFHSYHLTDKSNVYNFGVSSLSSSRRYSHSTTRGGTSTASRRTARANHPRGQPRHDHRRAA